MNHSHHQTMDRRAPVSPRAGHAAGFSLIEVNLAILVIGLGLLVVFALFPAGLREGENALTDTHTALFAETLLNGIRAKADTATGLEWRSPLEPDNARFPIAYDRVQKVSPFPRNSADPDDVMYYLMEDFHEDDSPIRSVSLWVWSGKHEPKNFKVQSEWFFTKYHYSGVKP